MEISGAERMHLNAAMTYLVSENEEEWLRSAQLVVDFGKNIPEASSLIIQVHKFREDPGKEVEGYVGRTGNVPFNDKSTEKSEKTYGLPFERVGLYRIAHLACNVIEFMHWRESGAFEAKDRKSHWLLYDEESCAAFAFLNVVYREVDPPLFIRLLVLPWEIVSEVSSIAKQIMFWLLGVRRIRHVERSFRMPFIKVIHSTSYLFRKGEELSAADLLRRIRFRAAA